MFKRTTRKDTESHSAWRPSQRLTLAPQIGPASLALILVMLCSMVALRAQNPFQTTYKAGDQAPAFDVQDLDGATLKLDNLRGKVVVLNFWFIACPPCRSEMPVLNELVDKYQDRGVVFVAFAADPPEALRDFLESHKFQYRVVPDATPIAERFGVRGAPTHIIIDPEGRFSKIVYGEIVDVETDLEEPIERLLEGRTG
jgi:peroxiredoxin